MRPFENFASSAVPLPRESIDTDQIIPIGYLKSVRRDGFEDGLFAEWRKDPNFVLNQVRYAEAKILVAGRDFGTGSSREHAVWALQNYGFRAVVSSRFGPIFRRNAHGNGLLAAELEEDSLRDLLFAITENPALPVTVDLRNQEVRWSGSVGEFTVSPDEKHRLLNGLDEIAVTLGLIDLIEKFEARRIEGLPSLPPAEPVSIPHRS